MERHKCKLCFRSFSNGKALGGHMRSHMLNLLIPSKIEQEEEEDQLDENQEPQSQKTTTLLSKETESSSSSSSSSEEDGEEEEKGMLYELRENPKRSIRTVDPEFSFAVDTGSLVLQDRESETESSKNPTRRRSKRTRKLGIMIQHHHQFHPQKIQELEAIKKIKLSKPNKTESWVETEPVSSVSDATTEEDVAYCLMMLSRDKWKKQEHEEEQQEKEGEGEGERLSDESEELKSSKVRTRGKYKCDTCNKVFKSYQALGGHRASHKKNMKLVSNYKNCLEEPEFDQQENAGTSNFVAEKKTHECPICLRVFSSGQALGGHKRSHVLGSSSTTNTTTRLVKNLTKLEDKNSLIDLNLPAPLDDDDEISQIELSAVYDAEFVNPIKKYSKISH